MCKKFHKYNLVQRNLKKKKEERNEVNYFSIHHGKAAKTLSLQFIIKLSLAWHKATIV